MFELFRAKHLNRWIPPYVHKPFLCDVCDKVRRWVWTTDGRTLICVSCRIRNWRKK